jgi:seryl-tRNA synthetase
MIDIILIREDKGGNIKLVEESEKRRFREKFGYVQKVIEKDKEWREKRGKVDHLNKAKGIVSKVYGEKMKKKKKVRKKIIKKSLPNF